MKRCCALVLILLAGLLGGAASAAPSDTPASAPIRLKDLGRIDGWRDNALVGYGIVTGLAGTGDT